MSEQESPNERERRIRDWHRLHALLWADLLTGEPVKVDWELDLSRKQQYLDILLIRTGPEPISVRLPDGFEELAAHNLISFKSFQEALDGWAVDELVSHYVSYRKLVSPSRENPIDADQFRLFAVCVRQPAYLRSIAANRVSPGVYAIRSFSKEIRVVVAHELPQEERNALMCLFSASTGQLRFGQETYHFRAADPSTILQQLFGHYAQEKDMPLDLKAFVEEARRKVFEQMTPKERLAGLSPEQVLAGMSEEEKQALRELLNAQKPIDDAS